MRIVIVGQRVFDDDSDRPDMRPDGIERAHLFLDKGFRYSLDHFFDRLFLAGLGLRGYTSNYDEHHRAEFFYDHFFDEFPGSFSS